MLYMEMLSGLSIFWLKGAFRNPFWRIVITLAIALGSTHFISESFETGQDPISTLHLLLRLTFCNMGWMCTAWISLKSVPVFEQPVFCTPGPVRKHAGAYTSQMKVLWVLNILPLPSLPVLWYSAPTKPHEVHLLCLHTVMISETWASFYAWHSP